MKELKTMKVNEIKSIARAMGIKGWWDMKKAQLIEAIENHQQTEPLIEDEHELVQMPGTEGEWIHPADEETSEDEPIEEVAPEAPETVEVITNETNHENEENVSEVKNEAHRKNQKRLIEYNGKTQTLTAWAKELGIRHQTLYNHIVMKGMDPAEAFEMPIKKLTKKEVI